GEWLLLVPPDRERRTAGRDLAGIGGLDAVALEGGPVEDRVRDRDLLRASLAEQDDERVEGVVIVEDDVRLDRLVFLVEHEERDAGPVAGDVFDPQVRHEDIDRAVADEVADDVDRKSTRLNYSHV